MEFFTHLMIVRKRNKKYLLSASWWLVLLLLVSGPGWVSAEPGQEAERRLAKSARFLASDALRGRAMGSAGIRQAAEFIRDEFQRIGLETQVYNGEPYQTFDVTVGAQLGEINTCGFYPSAGDGRVPAAVELALDEDFTPLAIGGVGIFDLPIAFVGYGITAPEADYDDYRNVDVAGKAVIILRHEPQQDNPHSVFEGTDHSEHAPFRKKISNAFQHGAAAVIFCTDSYEIDSRLGQWQKRIKVAEEELAAVGDQQSEEADKFRSDLDYYKSQLEAERDPVLEFTRAGTDGETREIPAFHVRRSVINDLLAASGHPSLAEIETQIDRTLVPQSFDIKGWRLAGEVQIQREQVEARNVVGILEGAGGLADETVIVGAHFDHLGLGQEGSAKPGSEEIHNGADDNASGVAVLLEVARSLVNRTEPLARRVVFVAFSGEEIGLLGSAEYVRDPLFPLQDTVAMLNFDMVGRMKDNTLIINGTGTSEQFGVWIEELNENFGLKITPSTGGFGPSDHSSFYAKEIPVLHFFTGSHSDYHRPSDDFHLLNVAGMRKVSQFVTDLTVLIANAPERVTYVKVAQKPLGDRRANPRPYFGSIPNFAEASGGYAISGTGPGSPAEKAGLRSGDVIVKLGDYRVGNLEDFDGALRKYSAGDAVPVVVRRAGKEQELTVTLDPPR
jgi:hypothetical protein